MILPRAKIVHVVRHPADAILSCYTQPFERRGVAWANSLPRVCQGGEVGLMFLHGGEGGEFQRRCPPCLLPLSQRVSALSSPPVAGIPSLCPGRGAVPSFPPPTAHLPRPAGIVEQYQRMRDVMALWRRVLPAGRVVEVRYEDLARRPEPTSRELLAALGLDWDPAVLDFHARGRHVATASAEQVREPVHDRAVQAWHPFAHWLVPALAGVRDDVLSYEREAGLDSSEPLFQRWEERRDEQRDEL